MEFLHIVDKKERDYKKKRSKKEIQYTYDCCRFIHYISLKKSVIFCLIVIRAATFEVVNGKNN